MIWKERDIRKYVTIGYGDEAGYERTPRAARDAAHAHDETLRKQGAVMGIAGLPIQVRNPEGALVETKTGAYSTSDLPIAGFALIEAANLAEAITMASRSPSAVAHGVIEVWPLEGA